MLWVTVGYADDMNMANDWEMLIKIIRFDWKKGTRGVSDCCENGVRDGDDNRWALMKVKNRMSKSK